MSKLGTLHEPNALFLRFAAGEAGPTSDGTMYELSTLTGGQMMVMNRTTGRSFSLNWEDLLTMAREGGIDKPVKNTRGKKLKVGL